MISQTGASCWARRLSIAILALALAALINIAIAWAFAYWPQTYPDGETFWSAQCGPGWLYQRRETFGSTQIHSVSASASALINNRTMAVQRPPRWSVMAREPQAETISVRERATC